MTNATRRVLAAMLADPTGRHYGYELLKRTAIKSGSLYPILDRLEKEGWIEGSWEANESEGRPPRRYYTLTGVGLREAKLALADAGTASHRLGPIGGM